jgi:hypothetical protein
LSRAFDWDTPNFLAEAFGDQIRRNQISSLGSIARQANIAIEDSVPKVLNRVDLNERWKQFSA